MQEKGEGRAHLILLFQWWAWVSYHLPHCLQLRWYLPLCVAKPAGFPLSGWLELCQKRYRDKRRKRLNTPSLEGEESRKKMQGLLTVTV